ncbi:ABC transporter ATP-binding protein [Phytomonospora endophytica]|uniref:Energy-coupling factor transport system ATP-binding protein n=1 Tax=Phytomonospora endophytica TaxID=714109 RepID=A0A841FGH1_9ACTN|nr:ABC transporter ATP-binding protein [Phytomonospora endophytica]MBB6034093.1 energy-coupling factor transport system ATP-binding protein [Phytomonospora endophytica]GIG66487.1 ABC transporter ATP-binding protein [Phytomonospora endophytica]
MASVELRGYGWRHAGRKARAVTGVDLRIGSGERVLLLGPSGSGKSTLLSALAGLLPEDSGEQTGELLIDGVEAVKARERTGIVFQDPQAQLVMARSGDDVAFGLENRGVDAAELWPRVDAAMAAVGFPYGRERETNALSGGEQQRLALAGVLASRPSLLLLDEPTANLDPEGAGQVREALRSVLAASEATMVLVEHRVAEVVDLVDRVVVLGEGGGLLADGPPGRVFAEHGDALTRQGVWVPGAPPVPERKAAGSPGETLVRADGVGRLHPGAAAPSLSDVDMAVAAGELVAVLGANGSGKSTLALMLGGLLRPTSGRVLLTGATAPPHKWRAPALARAVGSVFQNPEQQFVTSRVYDELALGPRRVGYDEAEVARTVGELLERLRLSPLAEANPFTLSGGQARRLSVATALATAPGLLVFDEPTFGQDRRTWTELVELIAGLRDEGRGVLAVTHDRDFTAALADRTVTIHEGRVAC